MLIHKPNYDHYLAISVSYKQDLWNLLEFIEYHRLVGVSHIFICNNDENTWLSDRVLEPYVNRNFVTNVHTATRFLGHRNRQQAAHNMCLSLARYRNVRWLALLDMDEFLFPVGDDKVTEVLKRYEEYPALAVHYACFGSSNYTNQPFLQTESYVYRAEDRWAWNRLCKAIGQVNKNSAVGHHHFFDERMVDEDKIKCGWVFHYKGEILRINHYMARSREDYMQKMKRGNPLGEKRDWSWFEWADRNEVFDDSMKRYIPALKDALLKQRELLKLSRSQVTLL